MWSHDTTVGWKACNRVNGEMRACIVVCQYLLPGWLFKKKLNDYQLVESRSTLQARLDINMMPLQTYKLLR